MGSKAKRKYEGRKDCTSEAEYYIEGAWRGEQTAILIDDLSLNPRRRDPPVALQRVLAVGELQLPSTREFAARGGGPPRKTMR